MPAPYPPELRERVLAACVAGDATQVAIAERFDVGLQTVVRWWGRFRRTGSGAPLPMGGQRSPYVVDDEGAVLIRETLDCNPDMTLPELCAMYVEARGVEVSPQTMSDTLRRLGYTRKRGSSAGSRRTGLTWLRNGKPLSRHSRSSTLRTSSSSMSPESTSR